MAFLHMDGPLPVAGRRCASVSNDAPLAPSIRVYALAGYTGPFVVMGRSLGSASVLELISCYAREIDGLIVESGFAYAEPLLRLLGIDMKALGVTEEEGFRNVDKMRTFPKPTLVIHAEHDHIIPFTDGKALYEACPAADKRLLMIPRANHNDIFARGIEPYMKAVKELTEKL